jgi:hypothetical protein
MYFVIGLSAVAALIIVLWLIAKGLAVLAGLSARKLNRLVSCRRKPRANKAKVPPTMTLPAVDRDWDSISRETRRSLLERGPRASRETALLSHLDLEIAIELKRRELHLLKAETAKLKAQSAKPRKSNNADQGDLFGLDRLEMPSQQTAVSGGFGPLSSQGQVHRTRVVRASRFMH